VPADEEIRRIGPVLDTLVADGVVVSLDSFQPETQRWGLAHGAAILNDIHGFPDPATYPMLAAATSAWAQDKFIVVSSTTSTENSGLFKHILPLFKRKTGVDVRVVAQGTGQALDTGRRGDADVVFVHAKAAEEKFIKEGHGVKRYPVMYNDFVLLGPPGDPAGVRKTKDAPDAFRAIASKGIPFISRGDESGTHVKEKEVWAAAGITPKGSWYIEAGQGMGEVLTMAAQKRGYALADRGTYIAFRKKTDLVVLRQGDKNLWNPYGIIAVNPAKYPHAKYGLAMKLIDFVTGAEGRSIISGYKVGGEQLFFVAGEGKKN